MVPICLPRVSLMADSMAAPTANGFALTVIDMAGSILASFVDLEPDCSVTQLKDLIRAELPEARRAYQLDLLYDQTHLSDGEVLVRAVLPTTAIVLALLTSPGADLVELLADESLWVAVEAAKNLGKLGVAAMQHAPALLEIAMAPRHELRKVALKSLGKIGLPFFSELIQALGDEDMHARHRAATALIKVVGGKGNLCEADVALLATFSGHSDWVVRRCVARVLGFGGGVTKLRMDVLQALTQDKNVDVRHHANQSLARIRPQESEPHSEILCSENSGDLRNLTGQVVRLRFNAIPDSGGKTFSLRPGEAFHGTWRHGSRSDLVWHSQVDVVSNKGRILESWVRESCDESFKKVDKPESTRA